MNKEYKVLWVDDDHNKDRFIYESTVITEDFNWDLECAGSLEKAAKLLSTNTYDALLLDQQFYVYEADEDDEKQSPERNIPWQGITLLYWLRNSRSLEENKQQLAAHSLEYVGSSLADLFDISLPLAANRSIDVCILSALYHEDVHEAMRNASKQDQNIEIYGKPVKLEDIETFLNGIKNNKDNNRG